MHELNGDWGNIKEGVSVLMFVVWEANQRDSLVFQPAKHFSLAVRQFDSSYVSADKYLSFNLLKPNDIYICRTAALTSRRYILNIYSTNIHTQYFKHAA